MNKSKTTAVELEIRKPNGEVSRHKMEERDSFIVGRGKDCDQSVAGDRTLSRHHFLMRINRSLVTIKDLGSHNNTFVNGKAIGNSETSDNIWITLHDQDTVRAGKTSFVVNIQIPAYCVDCGCLIPEAKRREAQYLKGTFLCMKCRGGEISAKPEKSQSKPVKPDKTLEVPEGIRPGKATPTEIINEFLKRAQAPAYKKNAPPVISGYENFELIGEGGFGAVHKARRLSDGKTVAVKTMLQTRKNNDCDCGLFKREQEICSQLKHPNIIEVYHFGHSGDIHFIEMEYLKGGTLYDRMKKSIDKRVPFEEASEIMLQCASGLAYAHSAPLVVTTRHGRKKVNGMVHRDLKPENIIFAEKNGQRIAKITDCGLAKAFELAGMTVGYLTRPGMWRGTAFYMSPEHIIRYHNIEPVTDVFELAATFFHMIAGVGVWPINKNIRPDKVILKSCPRKLKDHVKNLPSTVYRLFDDALTPKPEDRIQNGQEFLNALKGAL